MVIRRTATRFDRRRRALVEDSCNLKVRRPDSNSSQGEGAPRPYRRYPEGTFDDQPRLTDLIPLRPWAVSVWILCSLTIVLGLVTTDLVCRAYLAGSRIDVSALQLDTHRSLTNGATTLVLLSGALYASLILMLRRHRLDDYRGRYRVWYSIVVGLLVLSMGLTTGLGPLAWDLIGAVTQKHISIGAARWVPILAWGFGLAAGLRVLAEMRESRASVVGGVLTCVLGVMAHVVMVDWVTISPPALAKSMAHGFLVAAQFVGLLTLVLYARHVAIDSQGLLRQKALKESDRDESDRDESQADEPEKRRFWLSRLFRRGPRDESRTDSDESPAKTTTRSKQRRLKTAESTSTTNVSDDSNDSPSDSDRTVSARPRKPKHPPVTASIREADVPTADVADDDDGDESTLSLSRAERKRLRREKRKQRKAA